MRLVGESRGSRVWPTIAAAFKAFASIASGVRRARWGSKNHPITSHFLALLKSHATKLGWCVSADGWIEFSPEVPRPRSAPPARERVEGERKVVGDARPDTPRGGDHAHAPSLDKIRAASNRALAALATPPVAPSASALLAR
jgi:hypothetical protein